MREIGPLVGLICLAFGALAPAATFTFGHGPLALGFDGSTGALVRIARGEEVIAEAGPDRSPTSFGFGPERASNWLEQLKPGRRLVKQDQPSPDTLVLTIAVGDYEVVERYRLFADQPRMDRSATLTNRGKETVKLRAFTFRTPGLKATAEGFYRFPRQWPPRSHPFAEMKPGQSRTGGLSIAPLLAQLTPKRSLVFASCTEDTPHVRVEEGAGQFDVVQGTEAAGYLRPGEPQQIGFVSMFVIDAGYWDGLAKLWDWMDSVGVKVPADVPDWVHGAVLYSFHPGGTIGSNFTDLGGFKAATEYLLPTLPKLGVTAIWIMPVEYKGPYWPLDYYRFQDGLGTADEFRAMVKRAHELGLKVLLDLVPHGGAPQAVHNQQHPEFMLRREDGSTLTYWLNDFARPDWQDYIAKVAAHYVREYDVDGYRIDACYGSKEPNWDPAIPYARASHAGLKGGLEMVKRIRDEVKKLKPKDGAVLAEVESPRHAAVSDFQYDFSLCYTVLQAWRHMPAAEYVPLLQEYLEEQKYINPRGTLFLRHIESHDSLRAQGWYGVEGMEALYALSAWIDGVPLIYQDMEIGHSFALREINELRVRRKHPGPPAVPHEEVMHFDFGDYGEILWRQVRDELLPDRVDLNRTEVCYRAVKCNRPGVFTCLRKSGARESVAAINLGREPVSGRIELPSRDRRFSLDPLQSGVDHGLTRRQYIDSSYLLTPRQGGVTSRFLAFPGVREWVVDSIEGKLHDEFRTRRDAAKPFTHSSIYWRPQGTTEVWRSDTAPVVPGRVSLGALAPDNRWDFLALSAGAALNARLVERHVGGPGLYLTGIGEESSTILRGWPFGHFRPASASPFVASGAALRCVGPDYVVSNNHFTCVLRRQGGVMRELFAGDKVVAKEHDLYGDQEHFQLRDSARIAAGNDVESGIRIWKADDGLHLSFEGQLRGFGRFDLKRPPLWYRNEYVFTEGPAFTQKWAFRTEKSFKDKMAFLAAIVQLPEADRFRFIRNLPKDNLPKVPNLREVKPLAEDAVGEGGARRGQTNGGPVPERIEFLKDAKPLFSLTGLKTPEGEKPNVFVHGRQFFITLLDGKGSGMEEGRWYEFEAEWQVGDAK